MAAQHLTGVIVMVGASGSGKSTVAQTLASNAGGPETVISSDHVRTMLFGDPSIQGVATVAHEDVFAVVRSLAVGRLNQGLSVIIDSTNLKGANRRTYVELAREFGAPLTAILMDVDPDTLRSRNAGRDRVVPDYALERMIVQAANVTAKALHREGFGQVVVTDGDTSAMELVVGGWNQATRTGAFDVLGDIHGCVGTLHALLEKLGYDHDGIHPQGRTLVSVGDLVDRGPHSWEVLEWAKRLSDRGRLIVVKGNHEHKLARYLLKLVATVDAEQREQVLVDAVARSRHANPMAATIQQAMKLNLADHALAGWSQWMSRLPTHVILDEGRLAVVHGAIRAESIGQFGRDHEAWFLYGAPTGNTQPDGYPERSDWQSQWDGAAFVVCGHSVVNEPTFATAGGGSVNIDTGAFDTGHTKTERPRLTALRYPERTTVSVDTVTSDHQ